MAIDTVCETDTAELGVGDASKDGGALTPDTTLTAPPPDDDDDPQTPSFETVLEELGGFGRFQKSQLVIGLLGSLITASMTMSFVFLGYEPPYVCNTVNETDLLMAYSYSGGGLPYNSTTPTRLTYEACEIRISIPNANSSFGGGSSSVGISNSSGSSSSSSNSVPTPKSNNNYDVTTLSCPNGRNFSTYKHVSFLSEWDLVCESAGRAESSHLIFTAGQLVGGIAISSVADVVGRKPVLVVTSFLAFVTEFALIFAPSIYLFYGLRFFCGLFFQGLGCCFFVHGMELLLPKHRQIYGVVICIVWVFQLLVVGFFAYLFEDSSWRYFQGYVAASGGLFFVYPLFLLESPRWLAVRNRFDESLAILKKAAAMNGKDFRKVEAAFEAYKAHYLKTCSSGSGGSSLALAQLEFQTDSSDVCFRVGGGGGDSSSYDDDDDNDIDNKITKKKKKERDASLLTLLSRRKFILMTLAAWFIWITHNVTYYGLYMTSSTLVGNRFLNYSLMALVEIPSNLLILLAMAKMSRRLVLRIFLGLAATCLLASTLIVTLSASSQHTVLTTALFIAGKFAISASFNVLYILTPEIFPTSLRVSGSGSCTSVDKLGSMVTPFLRPLSNLAVWAPGVIFSLMCVLALTLTFLLPETRHANLTNTLDDSSHLQEKKTNRKNKNNKKQQKQHDAIVNGSSVPKDYQHQCPPYDDTPFIGNTTKV